MSDDTRERIEAWLKAMNIDKLPREFLDDFVKALGGSGNIVDWLMANEQWVNALPKEPSDSSEDTKSKAPIVPMDSSKIEAWLKANEKPEIHIDYAKPSAPIPVGASKIGGCPDVPVGFVWPRHKDDAVMDAGRKDMERPISFMAQFDLAEVAPFDKEGLLPKAGHLAFFYDYECFDDGGALCHEGSAARVFYFPPDTALERMALPDDTVEEGEIPELALTFSARTSRPVSNDWPEEVLGDTEADDDEYKAHNKAEQGCKLLGYPFTIQNPMEYECQVAFMGVEWDALKNPEIETAADAGVDDWLLLFQFDSIDVEGYADIMFCDCGALYFWIRKQDLAAGDFTHVYRCIQFY